MPPPPEPNGPHGAFRSLFKLSPFFSVPPPILPFRDTGLFLQVFLSLFERAPKLSDHRPHFVPQLWVILFRVLSLTRKAPSSAVFSSRLRLAGSPFFKFSLHYRFLVLTYDRGALTHRDLQKIGRSPPCAHNPELPVGQYLWCFSV